MLRYANRPILRLPVRTPTEGVEWPQVLLQTAITTGVTRVASNPALEAKLSLVTNEVRVALDDRLDRQVYKHFAVRTAADIAVRIDHTNLRASATSAHISALCARRGCGARLGIGLRQWQMGFAGDRRLASSTSMVCSIVGSPFGAMALRARAYGAFVAVQDGADEVDMVLGISAVLSGDFVAVFEAIATVVDAARPSPVEVIFEYCLLTDNQKIAACLMSAAGPAYVKTSTDMSTDGATVEAGHSCVPWLATHWVSRWQARSAVGRTPRRCWPPTPIGLAPPQRCNHL